MRPHGSPELLEYRRSVAIRLLDGGQGPCEVADVLGVNVRSVHRWAAAAAADPAALLARPHPGATPRLTDAQAGRVLSWLDRSPTAFGFANEWWTAPRLASVMLRELGVAMSHRYLNDWLRRRGVSPQMPGRVASERDPALVAGWVAHQWPRIKKK
jgi:transposase